MEEGGRENQEEGSGCGGPTFHSRAVPARAGQVTTRWSAVHLPIGEGVDLSGGKLQRLLVLALALAGCWSPGSAGSGLWGHGWLSLMYGKSLARVLPFLLSLQLTAFYPTTAVEIYTSGALEAVNGTDIRLKCTFSSFAPVGDALTVTWNFRPRDGGREQFVSRFLSPSRGLLTRMHCGNPSPLPPCLS